MIKFSSYVDIKLQGLNFEKLINFLLKNNINLINLNKDNFDELSFTLSLSDYNKTKKIKAFKNYHITVNREYGLVNAIKNIKFRVGIVTAVMVCLPIFVFFNMFTYDIKILGLKSLDQNQIISYLSDQNIKVGKINNIENESLELMLKDKFRDISLVSVIKKGTNIIVNIKEKEKIAQNQVKEIIANQNLMITSIEVNQGTAVKKAGDIVRAGEAIVLPYIKNDADEKIEVTPIATIEADVWYMGTEEFETKETVKSDTGKKIINTKYMINDKVILQSQTANKYKVFRAEVYTKQIFPNWFIPLTLYKEVVYEQTETIKTHNFEAVKNELIKKSKNLAYSSKPKEFEVLEELLNISTYGTKYIVQTSLKVNVKYKIN